MSLDVLRLTDPSELQRVYLYPFTVTIQNVHIDSFAYLHVYMCVYLSHLMLFAFIHICLCTCILIGIVRLFSTPLYNLHTSDTCHWDQATLQSGGHQQCWSWSSHISMTNLLQVCLVRERPNRSILILWKRIPPVHPEKDVVMWSSNRQVAMRICSGLQFRFHVSELWVSVGAQPEWLPTSWIACTWPTAARRSGPAFGRHLFSSGWLI